MNYPTANRRGFTLVELVLVIVVIGIIASIGLKAIQPGINQARYDATIKEMEALGQAITGDENLISDGFRSDYGYTGDIGSLPPDLDALVVNPAGYSTWNGPYILRGFAESGDDFKRDAWGSAYIYSGVSIVSDGNGSPITKLIASAPDELLANTVNGAVFDGLGRAPGDSASNVTVIIYYPDGSGYIAVQTVNPDNSGLFSFANSIPIGNHLVRAVYSTTADTVSAYIAVVPGSVAYREFHFAGSLW